jgi:hypothetical protein
VNSRRDFLLKFSSAFLAMPILQQAALANGKENFDKPDNDMVLKVAIMGFGSYATRVADAIKD